MLPTSDDLPDLVIDTSVAIALVVTDHVHHDDVFRALSDRRVGLSGHAAFETFSVLTRLPPPARLSPVAAGRLLARNFPGSVFLSDPAASRLFTMLPTLGIGGGSVYDALVGAAAKEHGIPLATRDRRAVQTYQALEVDYQLIGDARTTT